MLVFVAQSTAIIVGAIAKKSTDRIRARRAVHATRRPERTLLDLCLTSRAIEAFATDASERQIVAVRSAHAAVMARRTCAMIDFTGRHGALVTLEALQTIAQTGCDVAHTAVLALTIRCRARLPVEVALDVDGVRFAQTVVASMVD